MMNIILFLFYFLESFSVFTDDPYCGLDHVICVDDSGIDGHYSSLNSAIGNVSENSNILKIYVGKNISLVDDEAGKVIWIGRTEDQAQGNESHPITIQVHPNVTSPIEINCGELFQSSSMSETNFRAGYSVKNFFYFGVPYWKLSGDFHFLCSKPYFFYETMIAIGPSSKGLVEIEGITLGSLDENIQSERGYTGLLIYEDSGNVTKVKEFGGVKVMNSTFLRFHHAIKVQFGKPFNQLPLDGDYFEDEDDYKIEIGYCHFEGMLEHDPFISSSGIRFNQHGNDMVQFIGIGTHIHHCTTHDTKCLLSADYAVHVLVEDNFVNFNTPLLGDHACGVTIYKSYDHLKIRRNTFEFKAGGFTQSMISLFDSFSTVEISQNIFLGNQNPKAKAILFRKMSETTVIDENEFRDLKIAVNRPYLGSPCQVNFTRNYLKSVWSGISVKYDGCVFRVINNVFQEMTNNIMDVSSADFYFINNTGTSLKDGISVKTGSNMIMEGNDLEVVDGHLVFVGEGASVTIRNGNNFFRSIHSEEYAFQCIGPNSTIVVDNDRYHEDQMDSLVDSWVGQNGFLFDSGDLKNWNFDLFESSTIELLSNFIASKSFVAFKNVKNTESQILTNKTFNGGVEIRNSEDIILEGNIVRLQSSSEIRIISSGPEIRFNRNFIYKEEEVEDDNNFPSLIYFEYDWKDMNNNMSLINVENNIFVVGNNTKNRLGSAIIVRLISPSVPNQWSIQIQNNQFMMSSSYDFSPFLSLVYDDVSNNKFFDRFYFVSNFIHGLEDLGDEYVDYELIRFDSQGSEGLCVEKCVISFNVYHENYLVLHEYEPVSDDVEIGYNRYGELDNDYFPLLSSQLCQNPENLTILYDVSSCYRMNRRICGEFYPGISPSVDFENRTRYPVNVSGDPFLGDWAISVGAFELEVENCTEHYIYTRCPPQYYRGSEGECNISTCHSIFSNDTGKVCHGKGACIGYNLCLCENYDLFYGRNCSLTWDGTWSFLVGKGKEWEAGDPEVCPSGPYREDMRISQLRDEFCYTSVSSRSSSFVTWSAYSVNGSWFKNEMYCGEETKDDKGKMIETEEFSWEWSDQVNNFSSAVHRRSTTFLPLREAINDLHNLFIIIRLYNNTLYKETTCSVNNDYWNLLYEEVDEYRVFPIETCVYFKNHGYVKFYMDNNNCTSIFFRNFSDLETCGENDIYESESTTRITIGECYSNQDTVLFDSQQFHARYGYIYRDNICFPGSSSSNIIFQSCESCSDVCFGRSKYSYSILISSEERSCSGHGDCVDHNTCVCEENYYGEECNVTVCKNGIFSNDSKVRNVSCSGHGNCYEYNICDCDEWYGGDWCNVTVCQDDCGVHGTCVEVNNVCECDDHYFGDYCDVVTCNSILSNETDKVCNFGNGTCTAFDLCNCTNEYNGTWCQFRKIFPNNNNEDNDTGDEEDDDDNDEKGLGGGVVAAFVVSSVAFCSFLIVAVVFVVFVVFLCLSISGIILLVFYYRKKKIEGGRVRDNFGEDGGEEDKENQFRTSSLSESGSSESKEDETENGDSESDEENGSSESAEES